MKKLTAPQLKDARSRDFDLVLVNVLPADEHRARHIPGSRNVPLGHENFEGEVAEIVDDKDAQIVVYCAGPDCDASPRAAEKLERAGFRNVADLAGGLEEWKETGFALQGKAVGASGGA